ncbi:aminotransferase class V-fold PLP-dependent enzyme ['Paenibacillus yunnanensis' Narsing Rao et al. 2020]|uniref:aminotransferase class V-fold PLP-dependent enzyme n=1 Tax=Paenibacillus tengchongensis TaxID=2608684 RepID=UPI00124D8303|nr:aminotransferase class V-fold PLP-dependent enzyme [Paenibacillus tengchongensis]
MPSINPAASLEAPASLDEHFAYFRGRTVGIRQHIVTPYGRKPLLYADWTASGRLYEPIERRIQDSLGPMVSNPHTESNTTGLTMTLAYNEARRLIKEHVHAGAEDVLLFCGTGTTGAINKLLRLMGMKLPEWMTASVCPPEERPVVFVSHMEHHSNLLPWQESVADVVTVPPGHDGSTDIRQLEELLLQYRGRRMKIGSFTACSNVTGIKNPYHQLAAAMHRHGGVCFVDFAASAPYDSINMHPASPLEKLDAVFFSPHKFLGGPGSAGVLLFDARLAGGRLPDEPGGGTVVWVNPWGGRRYIDDLEIREDGGTPGFLQAFRTALSLKLKDQMNGDGRWMALREERLCSLLLNGLAGIPGCDILAGGQSRRHGIVSFILEDVHYNLVVRLLNDRFGIQARGGCSCAGPYGHHLLGLDEAQSAQIAAAVGTGDLSAKPGWVRLSLHPIMTEEEVLRIVAAVRDIAVHAGAWRKDYRYDPAANSWQHACGPDVTSASVRRLFVL